MKKILLLSTLTAACLATQNSSATLLAGWDFAGLAATSTTTFTPATISSTVGTGLLDISSFGLGSPQGTNPERTSFGGAGTVNSFTGAETGTGTALALASSTANGKSMILSFSMLGYEDLVLSFATRGTSTGFNTHVWSWSTDGITYSPLAGNNTAVNTSTFVVKTVDFSSEFTLDNASTAYLMLTVSGASNVNGNNRLDNIQLNATPIAVPEPSAMAIVGGFGMLALFMAARRRN